MDAQRSVFLLWRKIVKGLMVPGVILIDSERQE